MPRRFKLYIIFSLIIFALILILPKVLYAANLVNLEVPIGETKTISAEKNIAEYIFVIYKYLIGIVGIIATIVLMVGGVEWLTAGGSSEKIGSAKSRIGAALLGLVLTIGSYMILKTVNPDLVNLRPIKPIGIEEIKRGCCYYQKESGSTDMTCGMIEEKECTTNYGGTFDINLTCDTKANKCDQIGCCMTDDKTDFVERWICTEKMGKGTCENQGEVLNLNVEWVAGACIDPKCDN